MTFSRETENYYEVLGLRPEAGDEDVEAAYNDLCSMFAADRVPASRQDYARRQRARLAAAYAVLADPDRRAAYDAQLRGSGLSPDGMLGNSPLTQDAVEPEGEWMSSGSAEAPSVARSTGTLEDAASLSAPGPVQVPSAPTITFGPAPAAVTVEPLTSSADHAAPLGDGEDYVAEVAEQDEDDDADEDEEDEADEDEDVIEAQAADYTETGDEEPVSETPGSTAPAWEDALPPAPYSPPAAAAAVTSPPPVRRQTGGIRVEPAKPAPRPTAAPAAPVRTGGVALPTRREAAQIAARQPVATPAVPPPRTGGTRPAARPVRSYEYEEEELPRSRAPRPAPAPRKRKRNKNFGTQVMALVISLVLVIGALGSALTNLAIPVAGTTDNSGNPVINQPAATPNVANLIAQGGAYESQSLWSQAEAAYIQVLQNDSQNLMALVGVARVNERRQPPDINKAQSFAQQVLQIAPNSPEAQQAIQILAEVSQMPTATPLPAAPPATTP
ncbi:MAG TPA: DnaJ domain-containing protein [Chloroflexia bacterium]|nr:DnaJ domain-containing protein [Chloroflexia bacterium]